MEVFDSATVPMAALMWRGGSDTGMSSEAIWQHMVTGDCDGSYPHDPADLGRCLRLLNRVPEWQPRIGEMAKYGTVWSRLATHWQALADLMERECGVEAYRYNMAPETYEAMKRVEQGAKP